MALWFCARYRLRSSRFGSSLNAPELPWATALASRGLTAPSVKGERNSPPHRAGAGIKSEETPWVRDNWAPLSISGCGFLKDKRPI